MRWVLNSSKLRPSWLQDLLFFLHLITRAIIVQTISYGNDLIGFKSCSKGKCHRHLVLFPVFPVWKQITQIAKRKCHSCCHMESSMLQLKKLKEKIPSLLELPVRPHYNIKEKFFYMYETFTSKK